VKISAELYICDTFPLVLDVVPLDGENWLVRQDFIADGKLIQKDTITDFGSIPKFARGEISPTGFARSYLRHDDDYTKGDCTKKEADLELRKLMAIEAKLHLKVRALCIAANSGFIPEEPSGPRRQWIIYQGVNWFGLSAWNKHRREDAR